MRAQEAQAYPEKPLAFIRVCAIRMTELWGPEGVQNEQVMLGLPVPTITIRIPDCVFLWILGSGHHHISTGAAVGIGFACIVGVLIIAGAAFYWKKFYRRSRLRAAYYNDISMNDPLYEDFGPEVA